VLTLVQTKQIRKNIHKRKNTKTIHNTVNTITRITKTPTHYKTSYNNHSLRYTPNELITIQSSTFVPQELHRNSLHFTNTSQFTTLHFTYLHLNSLAWRPANLKNAEMSCLEKLKFWKRASNCKTGVVRGKLCLVVYVCCVLCSTQITDTHNYQIN
jgi:hypothetical protein